MQKSSKIYVAGHRGLVGSAIIRDLQAKGYDNIITRTHSELDLTNQVATQEFFASEKPEYVFLAAAKVGGIVANNTYRAEFIYDNLMIQNNVIHQSYIHGVKKLLFLVGSCVYPTNSPQPMLEEYLLTSPLEYTNEPYAVAKIAGMRMCESYNLQYGTNFISIAAANSYGLQDNFDLEKSHVLPALIRKIYLGKCLENNDWSAIADDLNKLPIENISGSNSRTEILAKLADFGINITKSKVCVEIWGTGKPIREFLWSDDMADACVFLMENVNFKDTYPENAKVINNTHINVGSGVDISMRQLAESIKDVIGFGGELYFNTKKPDGMMRKLTDVSKLHKLGWQHKVDLQEGIQTLFKWYINK